MTKNNYPSSEFENEDRCPSCGSPCNIHTDLDADDYCNDCRKNIKYIFSPYANPTVKHKVTTTGKVYEKGIHPHYKESIIIEVIDEDGYIHDAFEDELTIDKEL